MWTFGGASVAGSSHSAQGVECQDACLFGAGGAGGAGGESFWAVLADGAGSSRHAALAAQRTCDVVAAAIRQHLQGASTEVAGASASTSAHTLALGWATQARTALAELEDEYPGATPADFYCTLLGAVVGQGGGFTFHIGDGAIVDSTAAGEQTLRSAPSNGEFANTTWFLNQPEFAANLVVQQIPADVAAIALFTDGIQPLALNLQQMTPHAPFFNAFHGYLQGRSAGESAAFTDNLRTFLQSDRVNERTDDDKTLVMAVRTTIPKSVTAKPAPYKGAKAKPAPYKPVTAPTRAQRQRAARIKRKRRMKR